MKNVKNYSISNVSLTQKLAFIMVLVVFFVIVARFVMNFDHVQINFVLHSPSVAVDSKVYLVGNHKKLGGWQPDQIKMTYLGDHKWQKTLSFPKGEILEFKFTQGSWANEGANSKGYPLDNNYLTVTRKETTISKVEHWRTTDELPVQGQITGTVKYHRQFTGQDVLDRDIIVWLPPNYDTEPFQSYGVLYMHDGQNIIDPNTASFKVDWSVDETLDRLINNNQLPAMIVVGMSSTANRRAEYSPGEAGEAYMNFVVNQLKPFIDRNYRTKKTREHTLVGGSSMGGIISLMLLWQHNDIFSKAFCMSPAFRIDEIDFVSTVANYQGDKKNLKVYIDNGGLGQDLRLQPGIDEMLIALKNQGFANDLLWHVDKSANHSEAAWAKRLPDALMWLMAD